MEDMIFYNWSISRRSIIINNWNIIKRKWKRVIGIVYILGIRRKLVCLEYIVGVKSEKNGVRKVSRG